MSGAQQQQALAPKAGMQRIPFPVETYQHISSPLADKLLLNFYAEQAPFDARNNVVLMPCPGFATQFGVGAGPIAAMAVAQDMLYVASGGRFYRVRANASAPPTVEDLGPIGTPSATGIPTFVSIAVGTTAVVVCVPPNAFTTGLTAGAPLNQIGGDFPGATSVAYLDGYFVFTHPTDTTEFFISAINDPLDYDALDFAHTDAAPNILRRVVTFRSQLWFLGETGIEVWYDSGDADFPLRRMPGGILREGCGNGTSVAVGDNSVWWLGTDGIVYRSENFLARRVSTHALEWVIRQTNPLLAVRAVFTVENGHSFYALTLGGNRTFVYDCATKVWHNRASSSDGTGDWRPAAVQNWFGANFYGDNRSNAIFATALNVMTEDGAALFRQAVLPPLWAGTARGFCSRLEIETETGTGMASGTVTLDWSDDGGTTWVGNRPLSLGAAGELRKRLYATRLGSFRQRMFRITTMGSPTVYGIDADVTAGRS